jgi:hypothetical protein
VKRAPARLEEGGETVSKRSKLAPAQKASNTTSKTSAGKQKPKTAPKQRTATNATQKAPRNVVSCINSPDYYQS